MKKTIIIILSIATLLSIGLVLFSLRGNNSKPSSSNKNTSVTNSSSFPIVAQEILSNQVKKQMENYVSKDSSSNSSAVINSSQLSDANGKVLPLDTVFSSLETPLHPMLREIIIPNDYVLFSCKKSGQKSYGIMMNADLSKVKKTEKNEADELNFRMSVWENEMLKNLHPILFPEEKFSSNFLNQALKFKNGIYRYAEVNLPDGSKSSINYLVNNDSIFIATTPGCLKQGADTLFDP